MLRIVFWSLAASVVAGTALRAADQPPASENNSHEVHATLVGVDLDKNTVTFKTKGKHGKETEATMKPTRETH